ncbi:methyltransferase domain-containing protein (plasmid) [Natrinema zhouii]|uniref:SAM-dependent methyltransferase n=1 Tax=Natrinema zhouii TaxID=1710539 RepID=UPI001CFF594B|nr:class I SAM-dependent methyltransferase [Natrinema zhouii]UHQ98749.1 methyltransferase domain-containing protein [Natrinema zhouii]
MADWTSIDDPVARLHGFVSGFHATFYVYTGIECGLFEALIDPRTPSDLASQLGLHEPYVRRFCEIGLRWGLIEAKPRDGNGETDGTVQLAGDDDHYTFRLCKPFVQPLADPEAAQYMGDLFRFAAAHVSKDYGEYPQYFRSGKTRPFTDRGPAFTDVIEGTTRGLQTIFVEKLISESLPALEARLSRGGRVLDVGCGTGYLACQLCERYPDLTVIGVDLDEDAIDRAQERASEAGISDRTTFRVEDATTVAAEATSFDAAIFFMSQHEIDADGRIALFDTLGDVLVDDGIIAVFDEVYPSYPSKFDQQPFATGVETQWSELVWGNVIPTVAEQRKLFATAGQTEQSRTTFADRFIVYEGVNDND